MSSMDSVQAIINKVTKLRMDILEGRTDDNFIEENSWKYALLEEGQREVGPHEWDPFFSKPKDGKLPCSAKLSLCNFWLFFFVM